MSKYFDTMCKIYFYIFTFAKSGATKAILLFLITFYKQKTANVFSLYEI